MDEIFLGVVFGSLIWFCVFVLTHNFLLKK